LPSRSPSTVGRIGKNKIEGCGGQLFPQVQDIGLQDTDPFPQAVLLDIVPCQLCHLRLKFHSGYLGFRQAAGHNQRDHTASCPQVGNCQHSVTAREGTEQERIN
jgi:hypothetical protein